MKNATIANVMRSFFDMLISFPVSRRPPGGHDSHNVTPVSDALQESFRRQYHRLRLELRCPFQSKQRTVASCTCAFALEVRTVTKDPGPSFCTSLSPSETA